MPRVPARCDLVLATTTDLAALNASSLHFLGLAKALHAGGLTVTILAPRPSGALTVELNPSIGRIFTPNIPGLPRSAAIALMWPALRRLSLAQNLYVRSGVGTLGLVKAARALGFKRIVVENNGWFEDDLAVLGTSKPLQSLARRLQIAEARSADGVRVVTRGLGRLFEANGIAPEKIHHIGNGTDLDVFKPGNRSTAKQALGLSPETDVIVFVGNLWPAIDLPVVFQAAALLERRRPDLTIVVVGDGVARATFETAATQFLPRSDAVRWLGSRIPSEANAVLAAADVAIAPFVAARNERIGLSPLKLHDYAAAGRIVVATELPGISDFGDQPWLHLAKAHDAASYANAIDDALSADRQTAEASARIFAEQNFGWAVVARRVAALF